MIIGLDAGGTHTDVVLLDQDRLVRQAKVNTDQRDLLTTILNGLDAILEGIDQRTIRRAVLSTTLATNLVAQQQLPEVCMIVAAGPGIDPIHFATNDCYHTVQGALDHRGREIAPLDEAQVVSIGRQLQEQGIRYAGVVGKFSVRNAFHEQTMARLLAPFVERVFMGHQFSGSLNYPRRIATTYLNAAVYPVHKLFYQAVQESLARRGLTIPFRILRPDGGTMNFQSSLDHPAQTILSGPSASVMGALPSAPQLGTCLVLDIGGTTTDMALLVDQAPLLAPMGIEIPPYKTLIRALRTRSVGLGGDSAVRLLNGQLQIGPDRQGCAMAHGGSTPTPTDALAALGISDQGDRQRARDGLEPLAKGLGLSVDETAEQILTDTCRRILAHADDMVEAINAKPVYTVHELWQGSSITPDHLLILGGPARHFAGRLGTMFPGQVQVVPNWQVANAIGCALARTTCEVNLFVDTARRIAVAPVEDFSQTISGSFTLDDARQLALDLLRKKAVLRGASPDRLDTEIMEESVFHMIRGFQTTGRNIRIRAQVKPGLIQPEYC
jgi:N-methylhydantoinase A